MKKLLAAVTVLAVSTAKSATIHVDVANCPGAGDGSVGNPYCSIQTAIDNAVDTDEVVVAPGNYEESINFLGKAIWLHSSEGPEVTTIDAQQMGRVVTCTSGEGPDTVLDGFTITLGNNNSDGGGMLNIGSSPTVTNCTFSGNTAASGGGMFNVGGSPTVTNCSFSGNVAASGGGMFNGSATVTNCIFRGNFATQGGGMYNVGGGSTVTNCTFSDNGAAFGGDGMYNVGGGTTVTNCVLWGDGPDQILGGTPAVTYTNVQGGFAGTGNINADPLFVDPDNGDFRLQSGSPCIDAADNTAVPEDITTDLDGNPRFVDDACTPDTGNGTPPIIDMGAYEFGISVNCIGACCLVDGSCLDEQSPTECGNLGGVYNGNGTSCTSVTCVCTGPPLGLISWWDADAVSGTTVFDIQGENDGTMVGGVLIVPGQVGDAFSLDGANDFVRFPFGGTASQLSVELWVNPDSTSGNNAMFMIPSSSAGNRNEVFFGFTSGSTALTLIIDQASHNADVGVSNGVWTHVGFTFDGSTGIVYKNGVSVLSFSQTATLDFDACEGFIGMDVDDGCLGSPGNYFDGLIDEVSVYDRALSAPEILAIANAGSFGKCKDGTCPWDCETTPNGNIGINDFLALLAQWGTPGSCDFDGGGVGINDFLDLLANWGPCP